MKAVWISKAGGYDVLQLRQTPDPECKAGQVKVRAKACGINFSDVMARKGLYPDAPKIPCVVGYESAGVIEALGEGVSGLRVGQRVIALSRFYGQADVVVTSAEQIVPIPIHMSFEEAAAIPVAYLTAYHILFRIACVRSNESLLIHAAAGGVGLALLQLASTIPGLTIFGTASKSKHAFIEGMGVTHAIDYHAVDYADVVREKTEGKGVDAIFDSLGGKDLKKGFDLLRPGGRIVAFGFSNMSSGGSRSLWTLIREGVQIPFFSPLKLMDQNKTIAGVNLGHLWDETALLRSEFDAIMELYDKGVVKPHIDSTFPFDKAGDAHRRIEERKNVGKVLLIP